MKCNMGITDRVIRIVLGLGIGIAGIYFKNWWGLVALLPLLTGIAGFCPAYLPFKISTKCNKDNCHCGCQQESTEETKQ